MEELKNELPEEVSSEEIQATPSEPATNGEAVAVMHEKDLQKVAKKQKAFSVGIKVVIYFFLSIMAILMFFPFYWMIISSLKTEAEYLLNPPTLFPKEIVFGAYARAFSIANLGRLFLNTLYVGLISTILSLVITVLAAFAFARLEFKGKDAFFAFLLATMMIPGELFTLTNYETLMGGLVDWQDTFAILIVPFLVSVFYIYLLRQNFMQIPNELYLAAKVDGTSDFKYLWKVMIPLSIPNLISITILKMMGAWNSFAWPNLVIKDDAYQLVSSGISKKFAELATPTETFFTTQMAAVFMVSLPLFLVFIFLRKYIMKGVSRSGIKG